MARGNLKRQRSNPEAKIRDDVRTYLEGTGWLVQLFHNDQYQAGPPDLWAHHRTWSFRWIDTKVPTRYRFTDAQLIVWPHWEKHGVGVWIMTAGTEEEALKLRGPPNWRSYLRPFEIKRMKELSQENIWELLKELQNVRLK